MESTSTCNDDEKIINTQQSCESQSVEIVKHETNGNQSGDCDVVFTSFDGSNVTVSNVQQSSTTSSRSAQTLSNTRKSVSFHTLPKFDYMENGDNGPCRTENLKKRPTLTRQFQSSTRLDLVTGRIHGFDSHRNTTMDDTNQPMRVQYIKQVKKVVPAGEKRSSGNNSGSSGSSTSNTSAAKRRWMNLQQATMQKTLPSLSTLPSDNKNADTKDAVLDSNGTETRDDIQITSTSNKLSFATSEPHPVRHYRIRSQNANDESFWSVRSEMISSAISSYVTWTYRSSFYVTIIASYILFMVIMILFALGIYLAGVLQPDCIFVGSNQFSGHFMDAVHLSWTTLATVGYGIIGPQIPGYNKRWYATSRVE
jgi:hypothetical protein